LAGLAIAKHLEHFALATDQGKPLTVSATRISMRADDRYLRQFLAQWDELVLALGGEMEVLRRLELTPDGVLSVMDPSQPNAQRIFDLLMQMVPSTPHLSNYIPLSAAARFAPNSKSTRELVVSSLMASSGQYWETLIAGEIFSEHLGEDAELRHKIVDHILSLPPGPWDATLADLLLRYDSNLEKAVREKSRDAQYDVATHFKLVAALSRPSMVVAALEDILTRDLSETMQWHFPRWVPAVIRRIEKDPAVRELMMAAVTTQSSPSVKSSFVSLLGRAAGVDETLRAFAVGELQRTESEPIPDIGFDLSSRSYRLVRHVLFEAIGIAS
jgi:hypothetical protein